MRDWKWSLVVVAVGVPVALAWWLGTQDLSAAPRLALAAPQKEEAPKPQIRRATEAERKAAIAAIEAQLKAFKADDYEAAVKYQSAGLRENFRSVEEFRRMMKANYPQFASYKSVSFGESFCDPKGDQLEIRVVLTGQDGVTLRAVYMMTREGGEYKVGSVVGGQVPRRPPSDAEIV